MKRTLVTSDPHLGHERAAFHRGFDTVEEHDELIIFNWNRKARPTDTVYLLGDAVFRQSTALSLLGRLNGIKNLILGNHEHHDISKYLPYFRKIMAMVIYKERYIFTHVPVHPSQFNRFVGLVNVHGHIHKGQDELYIHDKRYFNVNMDFHNLTPLYIEELDQLIKERV